MEDQDLEHYLDSAAAVVGLPIDSRYREGVLLYLRISAHMAAQISVEPLADTLEPAPVFQP